MKIRTGCSGWSYSSWVGPFYPDGATPADFLKLYSKVFHTVEIDSTSLNPREREKNSLSVLILDDFRGFNFKIYW